MKDQRAVTDAKLRLVDSGKFLFAPAGEQEETFARVARALENVQLTLEVENNSRGYDPYNSTRRPSGQVNWYTRKR
jgi:predicted DNA-binding WGR domain protein